jgi:gliding motility-associated-like protein
MKCYNFDVVSRFILTFPDLAGMKNYISFFLFLIVCNFTFAQNISGIINSYTQVTGITSTIITTTSSAAFLVGDKILIIQMKGAAILNTNTSSYGDITSLNDAGNWEFATIAAISGNDIIITADLINTYNTTSGKVQMISVPSYCNVTLSDTLSCQPWDGLTGGVLVFISGGTVTMNADINVSGKGLRPGPTCNNSTLNCNNTGYFYNPNGCLAGWKGEGITEYVNSAQSGGRAKLANGGGGSNKGNSGGGGGGNYGAGGFGGFEDNSCGATGIQGYGGLALDYTLGKIFLGGAGGSSSGDDGGIIFPGTAGGGIVIIAANTINPNGFSIKAEGIDQTGITNDEGAGGGGAGGVVCLDVQSILAPMNVSVDGGDGGSIDNIIDPSGCQGPGGGGGGGTLWVSGSGLPVNIIFSGNGGAAGLMLTPSSICYNTTNGASAGEPGGTIFNFPTQTLPLSQPLVNLGNDTAICSLSSLTLSTNPGFLTFLWQDGSTDSTYIVSDSGLYTVKAADTLGCFSSDTIHVTFLPPYTFSIGNDTTVCFGNTVTLDAGAGFISYLWQDLSTLQTYTTDTAGIFLVTVVDTNGCTGIATLTVSNFGKPPLNIGNDTSICIGDKMVFNGGAFSSYLWQDGSTAPIFSATQPGIYFVTVTDFNGCMQSDTATLLGFYPQPPDTFLIDTVICTGQVILLEGPEGYASYLWTDSATTSAITVIEPGVYGLNITNEFSCNSSDSAIVALECPTHIFMPTAFTPNGDGINDLYQAVGYNLTSFLMRIYNRWGELVYVSYDITQGWNGISQGIKAEIGTYIYYVTWSGELDGVSSGGLIKGNLTLIR